MTANQIAYASEKEGERHNRVMEDLESEKNAINNRIADINAEHNRRMEQIQETYNQRYLELTQSQGDRKLDLQAEMNDLNVWKSEQEASHWARIDTLTARKNEIELAMQKETERANMAQEDIKTAYNDMLNYYYTESIRVEDAKRAQNAYQFEANRLLQQEQLLVEQEKVRTQQYQVQLGLFELQQKQLEWKDTQNQRDVNIFKTLTEGFRNTGAGIGGMFSGFIPRFPLPNIPASN